MSNHALVSGLRDHDPSSKCQQRLWSQIQSRALGLVWLCGSAVSGALLVLADLHAGAEAFSEAVVVLPKYVPLNVLEGCRV